MNPNTGIAVQISLQSWSTWEGMPVHISALSGSTAGMPSLGYMSTAEFVEQASASHRPVQVQTQHDADWILFLVVLLIGFGLGRMGR